MLQDAEANHKPLIKKMPNRRYKKLADIMTAPRELHPRANGDRLCPTSPGRAPQAMAFLGIGGQ
jgi:hypothetical protein